MNKSTFIDSKIFTSFISATRNKPLTLMLSVSTFIFIAILFLLATNDASGNILSAILGSTITSLATILGIITTNTLNERTRQREIAESTQNYKMTIASEIKSLWDAYLKGIGHFIINHQKNNAFMVYYPVHEKYFTAYENTPNMLCLLTEDVRSAVIDAYTCGKGLLDCYRYNNMLYDRIHQIYAISSMPGVDMQKCKIIDDEITRRMAEYAEVLLEYHYAAEQAMNNAYKLLLPQRIED